MLVLENIGKTYRMNGQDVVALDGVTLGVHEGEFLAIRGPSGSGKTTLLNLVGLLDKPSSGRILFQGRPISDSGARERMLARRDHLGFIFQSYNLVPELNVLENVEMPLHILRMPAAKRRDLVARIVDDVGLTRFAKHRPGELSGGQQQRVAIARALVKKPTLVVADEPTANLDSKTGLSIMELMASLNAKYGVTFIFATHDETILPFMNRVIQLVDGRIASDEQERP